METVLVTMHVRGNEVLYGNSFGDDACKSGNEDLRGNSFGDDACKSGNKCLHGNSLDTIVSE